MVHARLKKGARFEVKYCTAKRSDVITVNPINSTPYIFQSMNHELLNKIKHLALTKHEPEPEPSMNQVNFV